MEQILIVDDESLTVKLLSTYLRIMGHESVDALSSRQALDRLAYLAPDVVLRGASTTHQVVRCCLCVAHRILKHPAGDELA